MENSGIEAKKYLKAKENCFFNAAITSAFGAQININLTPK